MKRITHHGVWQMPAARIIGLLAVVATTGCASFGGAPSREPTAAGTKPGADAVAEPTASDAAPREPVASPNRPAAQSKPVAEPSPPVAVQPADPGAVEPVTSPTPAPVTQTANEKLASAAAPIAKVPANAPAPVTQTANEKLASAAAPIAKVPANAPAPAVTKELAAKKAAAPVPDKPAASPSLDLTWLEKQLKETSAIGVFTKLTLKNQVDDLVDRFKAYYAGRAKTTLADLRQPYDLLILKVLSLLQDGDPTLANAIRSSREAIWGILSDPAKFSKLAG